jgi:hypothetical protein
LGRAAEPTQIKKNEKAIGIFDATASLWRRAADRAGFSRVVEQASTAANLGIKAHAQPRVGRILMARGRDATDVAIVTSFGPCTLARFKVTTEEVMSTTPLET